MLSPPRRREEEAVESGGSMHGTKEQRASYRQRRLGRKLPGGGELPRQQNFGEVTLASIAAAWGVSRACIWNLERRAIKKLRLAIEQEAEAAGISVRDWLFGE